MKLVLRWTIETLKILGLVLVCVIGSIVTILAGSVLSADGSCRRDAFQLSDNLTQAIRYLQSGAAGSAPLTDFSSMRAIAEKDLARLAKDSMLPETLVKLDFERVGASVLRVTVVTEMGYPDSLIGLVGLTRSDLRAVSALEVRLRCMPWTVPSAKGPKGPTVTRRWTGPLDWYLLGYASRGAAAVDVLSIDRFAPSDDDPTFSVSDAWPDECSAADTAATTSYVPESYEKDVIGPFKPVGQHLN